MTGAKADSLTGRWLGLPEELRAKLRLGFTGKLQLLDIAGWCVRRHDPVLMEVAGSALRRAVRDNPLDGDMARTLLRLDALPTLLDAEVVERLTLLADHWKRPDDHAGFLRLLAARDHGQTTAYLRKAVDDEPANLFWREQAMMVGTVEGDDKFIANIFEIDTNKGVDFIISESLERSRAYFKGKFIPEEVSLLGQLNAEPWDAGLTLRAHDALNPPQSQSLPGRVAVLLYSWNKADELDETLASLLASDLTGASVFVLDNGSTDRTAAILTAWEPRFADSLGADRFRIVSLPVNIGAAAARNWLLSLPEVREHEFCCYLDDDVELPADWLHRFGAAVGAYPDAGVWGCKVVDHFNPLLIQSADSHLLVEPGALFDLTRLSPNPFKLSDLHIQTVDTGEFDFLRPCASVTGCCHLFRTETLLDTGGFAIQLSPSQYDDMEHDLRLCESGRFPVYQGHLAVRHKKRTGAAARTDMRQEGNALGNKYKMQTLHEPEALTQAMQAEQQLLEADLVRKLEYLDSVE